MIKLKLLNQTVIIIILTIIFIFISINNVLAVEDNEFDYPINNKICEHTYDPLEKLNRKILIFNGILDYFILRPVTIFYKNITNDYIKDRVSSFVGNINTPFTAIQYGAQLNFEYGMKSVWRFLINSTFGVFGLFDVATKIGIDSPKQTIGSTLAFYGVGPGPYLVLPIYGPTNARDFTDNFFGSGSLNTIIYDNKILTTGSTIAQVINMRMALLPFGEYVAKNSLDPYITIRNAMHSNRESSIKFDKDFTCPKQ